jgi:hypothetical protein
VAAAISVVMAMPAAVRAQNESDPSEQARVRIGVLAFTPSITVSNFGIESNVFNEAANPKGDLTATVSPEIALWIGKGRVRFAGASRLDSIHFKEYSGENSVNTINTARLEFPFNRVRAYLSGLFLAVTERPDFEVDTRARREQSSLEAGVSIRASGRTWMRLAVVENDVTFAEQRGLGVPDLRESLSRQGRILRGGLDYALTPLTTFVLDVDREQTEFRFSPERDANGIRITPGFTFKPHALLSGALRVGVLKFTPVDPRAKDYMGTTASVDLRYLGVGDTEIVGGVQRDLFYSADAQTYYLQTGVSVGMTRYLSAQWSVSAGAAKTWLAYSPAVALIVVTPMQLSRPDEVVSLSAAVSRRVAGARIGAAVVFAHRDSDRPSGRYDNFRLVGTVSYGAR